MLNSPHFNHSPLQMMTEQEIFEKLKPVIAETFVIDEVNVQPDSFLIQDLGADSIGFLEFFFEIEDTFGIILNREDLQAIVRGGLSEEEFQQDGVVTPEGILMLKKVFVDLPVERFEKLIHVSELPSFITVNLMCHLLKEKGA